MFGFFGVPSHWGSDSWPALGRPGFGPGVPPFAFGGPHFGAGSPACGVGGGPGGGLLPPPAIIGTAAMLLAGPADAEQIVHRVSEATDGVLQPPRDTVELALGLLAGRGVVTVSDGVATLTELGQGLLTFQGISSETARVFLVRIAPFAEAMDFQRELFEFAELATGILRAGTDGQKRQVADAKSGIRSAVKDGRQKLHHVLADS